MKTYYCILITVFITASFCYSQSKKELEEQIIKLTSAQTALMNEMISIKQQVQNLKQELTTLKTENYRLSTQIASLQAVSSAKTGYETSGNNPNNSNTSANVEGGRCQAITQKGTQCSRNADSGSNYCWQHKSTYEPTTQQKVSSGTTSSGSSTYNGRTIYTGPRGGRYYINKNGNKTYIKR